MNQRRREADRWCWALNKSSRTDKHLSAARSHLHNEACWFCALTLDVHAHAATWPSLMITLMRHLHSQKFSCARIRSRVRWQDHIIQDWCDVLTRTRSLNSHTHTHRQRTPTRTSNTHTAHNTLHTPQHQKPTRNTHTNAHPEHTRFVTDKLA